MTDVGIDPEKTESLGVSWKLNCHEQACISKSEFVNGFAALGADTMTKIKKEMEEMKKALAQKNSFKPFYNWLFNYCTGEKRKTMGM